MERGFTIWFTGLSGSGKTTLSKMLEAELRKRGLTRIEILDGDVVRTHLSKGLGFSKEDRDTNIKRIGFVCKLLSRNGVVAIAAAISPYREIRDYNRKEIGDFVEVYCKCSWMFASKRDVKGLYKKALAERSKNYTGVDDPYEEPLNPEVVLRDGSGEPRKNRSRKIIQKLEMLGYLPPREEAVYTAEEEEKVKKRLEDWGYLLMELWKSKKKRVVVIGLDGVPHSFVQEMIRERRISKFAGPSSRRISGKDEVNDSLRLIGSLVLLYDRPKSRESTISMALWIGIQSLLTSIFPLQRTWVAQTLWEALGQQGKRVLVINVPLTYPPRPVNGILIGCFLCMNIDKVAYPKEVSQTLKAMGYRIDADARQARRTKPSFWKISMRR